MPEVPLCLVCGAEGASVVYAGPDEMLQEGGKPLPVAYVACSGCSAIRLSPRLDEARIEAIYGPEYWSTDALDVNGVWWTLRRGFVEDRLRVAIERHAFLQETGLAPTRPDRRVLEIGSGAGLVLKVFQENGWAVQGVEPTPLAHFANAAGIPTQNGFFDAKEWPDASVDLISLFHVFEHLPDPMGMLRATRAILRPGGRLWIEVPNVERPRAIDITNAHLTFWSERTLANALRLSGYRVLLIEPYESRNAAFSVLHAVAEVGDEDATPGHDDATAIATAFRKSVRLFRAKQAARDLGRAHLAARVPVIGATGSAPDRG